MKESNKQLTRWESIKATIYIEHDSLIAKCLMDGEDLRSNPKLVKY